MNPKPDQPKFKYKFEVPTSEEWKGVSFSFKCAHCGTYFDPPKEEKLPDIQCPVCLSAQVEVIKMEQKPERKHAHYFRNVSHLKVIDIYRLLELFEVTDNAIGHAIKKLLCSGKRGVKPTSQDIKEAIDTLQRWLEMREEDLNE